MRMKKSLLKIYFACAMAAFFAACTATGDVVGGDEDELSPSVQKISSSSVAESSSSKVKSSSSKVLSSSSNKVIESSSSKVKSSSSKVLSSSSSKVTESSSSKVKSSSSKISSSSCSSEMSSSPSVQKNSSSSVAESSSAGVKSIYDAVEESGLYTTRDSVAAYLCKFDKLPANYVGKNEGKKLYESKTGKTFEKWNFNPWTTINVMIGGDNFDNFASSPDNYHATLPEGSYHEADVEYSAKNRGTKRLVYQPDCVIYYTADHYETFTRLEVR